MANSRGWGLLSCQIPRGGDEKGEQMPRSPSTMQHFSLIAQSNSSILSILVCDFYSDRKPRACLKVREWPRGWQMPVPRAVQNLHMPHPRTKRFILAVRTCLVTGSLSNEDDNDGNKNGKKKWFSILAKKQLCTWSRFLVQFFAVLVRLHCEST